ncbi:MAG: hypothetical protein ABI573_07440 [Chloroflexota bacterium]
MTFGELLAASILAFQRAGVAFMVTGSLASSYYGEPRATRGIDTDPGGLERLVIALQQAGLYMDRDAAIAAHVQKSQFNAIADGAAKVDFIVRRDRPFSVEEFARRQSADLLGTPGFIVSVEDLIVAKLEWASESGSEVQLRDVRSMLAVGGSTLDRTYISRWIARLGLGEMWERVRRLIRDHDPRLGPAAARRRRRMSDELTAEM